MKGLNKSTALFTMLRDMNSVTLYSCLIHMCSISNMSRIILHSSRIVFLYLTKLTIWKVLPRKEAQFQFRFKIFDILILHMQKQFKFMIYSTNNIYFRFLLFFKITLKESIKIIEKTIDFIKEIFCFKF